MIKQKKLKWKQKYPTKLGKSYYVQLCGYPWWPPDLLWLGFDSLWYSPHYDGGKSYDDLRSYLHAGDMDVMFYGPLRDPELSRDMC